MQSNEFTKRRTTFLKQMRHDSIAIIVNNSEKIRNGNVCYPFHSDSDFFYLTGFNEPNAIAVFINKKNLQYILFCAQKDTKKELWTGEIIGCEKAVSEYGADKSYPIDDIGIILPQMLKNKSTLIYSIGKHKLIDTLLPSWFDQIKNQTSTYNVYPKSITSPDDYLHTMRLLKNPYELSKINQAVDITAKGHIRAMRACQPLMTEYQLEAELLYEFNQSGVAVAYPSIVAGGNNACILHYNKNNKPLCDGDLVLIDAGAEYDYYASDVTRTFPVNGKFTTPQREIYQLVLDAQIATINQVKLGNCWDDLHKTAVRVITKGLIKLGILSGNLDESIKSKQYKTFFMHQTGHWLGMDVHDVGNYRTKNNDSCLLEEGMVFTIEPGIYIPKHSKVSKQYRGIGVRIEDNILINKNGCQILTNKIPKTIDDIEQIMQQNN